MSSEEGEMAAGGSYRNLLAWERGLDLVEAVYQVSGSWPTDELYGLTNQARRAAASIPANIAEGHGRKGSLASKEFARHLAIAYGSLCELETHLILAKRLGFIDDLHQGWLNAQTAEVARLIQGLIKRERAKVGND